MYIVYITLDNAAIHDFTSIEQGTLSLELKHKFSKLPSQLPMFILRTWSNGWLTTSRMHEANAMPCVFGCDEEVDSLHHYLRCEALWALVYTCTNSNNSSLLQQSIEERCCIRNISPPNLMRLYSASATYHSLRKLHAELLENAVSSGDFTWVYETAMQHIKIHCGECKSAS